MSYLKRFLVAPARSFLLNLSYNNQRNLSIILTAHKFIPEPIQIKIISKELIKGILNRAPFNELKTQ